MYIDKVKIKIKSGNGGDGHISFHQEKFVQHGGPNGGNGGKGGDIIFVADEGVNTLIDFYYNKHYRAENGERGDIRNCSGKSGKDLVIKVPCGTVVKDAATDRIISDIFYPEQPVVILRGGRGGYGNQHFANSRRQAPAFAQKGKQTVEREITLELKTIADVGLVGFPNVGKSTFLSVVSQARPKIANYHFTTLSPNLGVVKYYDTSWVVADIPGLIEGASEGAGLGHSFLRHIERTRMIIHIIDISGSEGRNPAADYFTINNELKTFSPVLAGLPQIVALNKSDLLPEGSTAVEDFKAEVKKAVDAKDIFVISGATNSGIKEVNDRIYKMLKELPKIEPLEFPEFDWDIADPDSYEIVRLDGDTFEITGGLVEKISQNVVFDNYDSLNYFHKILRNTEVVQKLYALGAKDGDSIIMKDMEFEFIV